MTARLPKARRYAPQTPFNPQSSKPPVLGKNGEAFVYWTVHTARAPLVGPPCLARLLNPTLPVLRVPMPVGA